jgi:microcystin-dependent protein
MDNYVGEIKSFAGDFAPDGWAFCHGQLLPINDNQALYDLLGTAYGGDGITTFGLPDLRSRVPVQRNDHYPLGVKSGAESVTLLPGQLPSHTHIVHASQNNTPNNNGPANGFWAANNNQPMYGEPPADTSLSAESTTVAGGGLPHENRVPFVAVNFIIALWGIFPTRD